MARALVGAPWAFMGQALVGPMGPWALMGWSLVGPWAAHGPSWAGPSCAPWALMGRALMGPMGQNSAKMLGGPLLLISF